MQIKLDSRLQLLLGSLGPKAYRRAVKGVGLKTGLEALEAGLVDATGPLDRNRKYRLTKEGYALKVELKKSSSA
jgi:hypothetical protein